MEELSLPVSMKQVFIDEPISVEQTFALDEKQAHHLFDVLRTKPQETVRVISNEQVFLAHPRQKPCLYVFGKEEVSPRLVDVTLCPALIKSDRFEWMLQKAAELGVSRIVPFTCRNSIIALDPGKAAKKLARWQSILDAACKQSNRVDKVLLEPIQNVSTLNEFKGKKSLVAYEKEQKSHHLSNYLRDYPESITIVIGPEGGFTEEEIDLLNRQGFACCSLGDQILRAETASLYALSAIDYQYHCPKEEVDA